MAHGSVDSCEISMRSTMIRSLLCGACKVAIVHNPSSDTTPSESDKVVCKKLKEACSIIGLMLLDFLIVGGSNYYSFKEMEQL